MDLDNAKDLAEMGRIRSRHSNEAGVVWRQIMAEMSLGGDPLATKYLAFEAMAAIKAGFGLAPDQAEWVAQVLWRINDNPEAASAIARGPGKRGAPNKDYSGFLIAFRVFEQIFDGAPSMESAWAEVSLSESVSEETVKRHWIAWKPKVFEVLATTKRDVPATIKEMLRSSRRGNKSGIVAPPKKDGIFGPDGT